MFIEKFSNNGIPYLRLVQSQRFTKPDGSRSVRKKYIYNIGPLAKFDDGQPDFLDRLKDSFKRGDPLIPALLPYCSSAPYREKYHFELQEGDPLCIGHPKLFSHVLLERIMEELGLISFFNRYKQLTNYQFDLTGFFRLLIYGRILNPSSKIKTVAQNDDYYLPILKDSFYDHNVYDTLDFIYDYKKSLVNKLNRSLVQKFNRTTHLIYYDVTNFFFEIEHPDEDVINEDGSTTKGLRKMGVSKENRKLPIVQMGLFMDEQGVPICINTFPGNTLDHQTVIQSLKDSIDPLNMPRFIFVGDRGMYNGTNASYLLDSNNGYIMSKSIDKTKAEEKEWIFDDEDYIWQGKDFKYKSKIIKSKVKKEDGSYTEIIEKKVAYWSKKFYDKQIAENRSFLDFLDKLEENPENFRITKSQSQRLRNFLKKESVHEDTGEIIDTSKLRMMIDYDKVNRYKKQFGYYQLVTSELEMPDTEVIDTYHGLTEIETEFQTMKGDLNARPFRVSTPEHIEAHLITCMIALTIIRLIQSRIVTYKGKDPKKQWEFGLSAERIKDAMNKWTVEELADGYYRFNNIDDTDLKLILDAFDIEIKRKLYRRGELKSLKTGIKITT